MGIDGLNKEGWFRCWGLEGVEGDRIVVVES